jgi:hypothetical protein
MHSPYHRLAIAVLHRAVADAAAGDRGAEWFLIGRGARLLLWCALADLDPAAVRSRVSVSRP